MTVLPISQHKINFLLVQVTGMKRRFHYWTQTTSPYTNGYLTGYTPPSLKGTNIHKLPLGTMHSNHGSNSLIIASPTGRLADAKACPVIIELACQALFFVLQWHRCVPNRNGRRHYILG